MKAWILIPVGAGAALLGYGLLAGAAKPKALEHLPAQPSDPNTIPKHDPSTIPQHTKKKTNTSRQDQPDTPTYCELITAYRQDLRRYKTEQDDAKMRMNDALREAQQVCDEFAWNASWKYVYAGLFGSNGWTEFHKEKSSALKASCQEYVKGAVDDPGKPTIPSPPTKGAYWYDGTYTDVAQKIRDLKNQVEDARSALPGLRQKYASAKKDYDRAHAKVVDLVKKIADLQAQGVECGKA